MAVNPPSVPSDAYKVVTGSGETVYRQNVPGGYVDISSEGKVLKSVTTQRTAEGGRQVTTTTHAQPSTEPQYTVTSSSGKQVGVSIAPSVAKQMIESYNIAESSQRSIAPSILAQERARTTFETAINQPLDITTFTAPRTVAPEETLSGITTTRVFKPSMESTVVPTSQAFPGYLTPEYRIQKFGEELKIKSVREPSRAGFYNVLGFGVGIGSGIFKSVTKPVETFVVAPVQAVFAPRKTFSAIGESLSTNPEFFLGEQVGTGLTLKGVGSGVKGISDVALNKYFKFEPVNVEGVQTRVESLSFDKNVLTGKDIFSGVEASKSQGLFKVDNSFFKVTGVGSGKLVDVADATKFFKGREILKVQEGAYSDKGFFGVVGRPRIVRMDIVGTVGGGEESVFSGLSKFRGKGVNVNRILRTSISGVDNQKFSGVSFDVNKVFEGVKGSGKVFAGRSVKLFEERGVALTGEPFVKTVSGSVLTGFETRPLENIYRDVGVSKKDLSVPKPSGEVSVGGKVLKLESRPQVLGSLESSKVVGDVYKSIKIGKISKSISKSVSVSRGVALTGGLRLSTKGVSRTVSVKPLSLESPKSSSKSLIDLKNVVSPISKSFQESIPKSVQKSLTRQATIPKLEQMQRLTPRTVQSSISELPSISLPSGKSIPFKIAPLPSLSSSFISLKKRIGGGKGLRVKYKYEPSVEASFFGIRGRKPSKALAESGLVLRPIVSR